MTDKEIQLTKLWVDKLKDREKHSFPNLLQEFSEEDQKLAEEVLSRLIDDKYVTLTNFSFSSGWLLQLQRDWSPTK